MQRLENTYEVKWWPEPKERIMFHRRKIIIDEVYSSARNGMSASLAVEEAELLRTRSNFNSLDKLTKFLKNNTG